MAKSEKGEVAATLYGQPVVLVLDFNAQCELEDLYGTSIVKVVEDMAAAFAAGRPNMRDVRAILWAGMLRDNAKASLRDAGNLEPPEGEAPGDLCLALMIAAGFVDPDAGADGEDEAGNAPPPESDPPPA